MRTKLTIFVTLLYVLSYSLFLAKVIDCTVQNSRIWVNLTFALFSTFVYVDGQYKCDEYWHVQFYKIAFLSLILNLFQMSAYYITCSIDNITKLIIFNCSIAIASFIVIISGQRHGLFKTNEK